MPTSTIKKTSPKKSKRKKKKKSRFKTGFFLSLKTNQQIHYRSSWELTAYMFLDNQEGVLSFSTETLAIPYIHPKLGYSRNYLPDLIIEFVDGTKQIIEIKPKRFLKNKINVAKFRAAISFSEQNGYLPFEIWGEEKIKSILTQLPLTP
jgi:hypothetical protein